MSEHADLAAKHLEIAEERLNTIRMRELPDEPKAYALVGIGRAILAVADAINEAVAELPVSGR